MKTLFATILIILGSFLEIYFYVYRFTTDGLNLWLSIIIGIALTLFLSLLMILRGKKGIPLLIGAVAIYSVICTSSGQSFSLSELQNNQTKEAVQEDNRAIQISEYLEEIKLLNAELDQLSQQITITNTYNRNKYADAVEAVQSRIDKIKSEKTEIQNKINDLRSQQTISAEHKKETTNIYQFYHNLFGVNAGWLQFILQTILSAFIAAMSPVSIMLLTGKTGIKQKITKPKQSTPSKQQTPKPQKVDYKELIKNWVHLSWLPYRQNKSPKLLSADNFYKYWNVQYDKGYVKYKFPREIYDKIKNTAIKLKLVDKNGNLIDNRLSDPDKSELILNAIKE